MDNKGRNIVIGALLAAIAIMAVGYAALSQSLTINGTASISSTWDVQIISISEGTPENGASNASSPTHDGTSATFSTNLTVPGSKMTYEITVKNSGNLNAMLTGLTKSPDSPAATGIYYNVTGVEQGVTTLDAGETNVITVEVGWVSTDTSMPVTKTVPLTVNLTYTQY